MEFQFEVTRFKKDPAGWNQFTISPTGVVGSDLRRRGRKLVLLAQRSVQKKTGNLARSINMQYVAVKNPWVRVGSDEKHALMMHSGTRPHWIAPDHRQLLRFKSKGKIVYIERVHHPGTKGSFYLTRHLRTVVK